MLPSKRRKTIIVNGVLYHYIVKGYVSVIIRNSVTGAIIKWCEDWKPKWKMQLKPSDIEQIIIANETNTSTTGKAEHLGNGTDTAIP